MKANPAFIVDGFTEKNIIDKICPNRPVRRTDLNGKDVTLDAIADRLASYIRLFNNKYYPIIVIIDKENRPQNCNEITDYLNTKLNKLGFSNHDIRINIADRMIENWLIADLQLFSNELPPPKDIDGINGASQLRMIFGKYSKSTDCLKVLKNFSPEVAYHNSNSFKKFVDSVENIGCDFTKFKKQD